MSDGAGVLRGGIRETWLDSLMHKGEYAIEQSLIMTFATDLVIKRLLSSLLLGLVRLNPTSIVSRPMSPSGENETQPGSSELIRRLVVLCHTEGGSRVTE